MDKFKTSDWLMVAGGAVMLIFGVALDWAKLGPVSGNNAFDYFFTGGIAWLLTSAAAVIVVLLATGVIKPTSGMPWPLILVGGTGLATLLMLIRLILGGGEEQGIDLDRNTGMYVAFVAAAVTCAGAVMNFLASGGNLKDLTDPSKIKGSFNRES